MKTVYPQAHTESIALAFEDGLLHIGYSALQIRKNYGYSNFIGTEGRERLTVDLAAFGGGVPSMRSCNIAVAATMSKPEEIVSLRALGAPLIFTYDYRRQVVSWWGMPKSGLPNALDFGRDITLDRLPDYFEQNRTKLEPDAFRQARTATFRDGSSQLDFFDLGLLPALEGELQRKLSDQIQNIAARSREMLNEREGDGAFERQFAAYARLLFRLLAGRLLRDRGDLPLLSSKPSVHDVLVAVETKYSHSGSIEPALDNVLVQNSVWSELETGLDLTNLSPETLAFVYENTLVDASLRRLNGIHSTPPQVADFLLSRLPIERLPESSRVVFEPFCGNAPFLLAAMRRLHDLLSGDSTATEVHKYLVDRLLGIELLPIAREIAVCSLVLGDYPNDNSWQIINGDVFADPTFDAFLKKADVVLCNPPHENFSPLNRVDDWHHNQAAEGLARVLKYPPKLLGFVMPLSFVDGSDYKSLRRELSEVYPYIDITALPNNIFGNADQETALIAAHKLDAEKKYRWSLVGAKDYHRKSLVGGTTTLYEERDSLPEDSDGTPILWRRPQGQLADVWSGLVNCKPLSQYAEVRVGIQHKVGYKGASNSPSEGFALGIQTIRGGLMEPYLIANPQYIDIRRENLRRPKVLEYPWADSKVMVNASRSGVGEWRLIAVHDEEGFYASRRFWVVFPKLQTDVPASVIAAVLNGPVANAFARAMNHDRDNDSRHLKDTPFPSLTKSEVEEIIDLIDEYKDIRMQCAADGDELESADALHVRKALLKIDAAILDAYGLTDEIELILLDQFSGVRRGHLQFAFNGYSPSEWADAKSDLANAREARKIAEEFSELLRKRNLHGLDEAEQEQYEYLKSLREARQMSYRNLINSDK